LILFIFSLLIRLIKSDFYFLGNKMSKKIIALSILGLFAFVCWCGSKDDSKTNDTPKEIPVAEKTDWKAIEMQWDRGGETVDVNENFEEPL